MYPLVRNTTLRCQWVSSFIEVIMDVDEWFKDPKVLEKSKRKYAHFDLRTDLSKCKNYITDTKKIRRHGFYPFIRYNLEYHKYDKINGKKCKSRTICYAAHIDSCIYQYYSFLINQKYNLRLKKDRIYEVPIAYRTDLHTDTITEFYKMYHFINEHPSCYVMIGDFTSFFDRINHQYLKERLCDLLQVNKLSSDYYTVFKRITNYDYWDLDDLYSLNNLNPTNRKDKIAFNSKQRVLSKKAYKKYRSHIKHHYGNEGIPQGSSISACLANVYMLEIDKTINDFVVRCGGVYRRYSDDFIIILPMDMSSVDDIEAIIKRFESFKTRKILELQPAKTQIYKVQNHTVKNIGHLFTPKLNEKHKTINFIGFTFDGNKVIIRDKTTTKYYYRMRHKAKGVAHQYKQGKGYPGSDKLYRLYSPNGQYGKGNYFTYLKRVQRTFPDQPIMIPADKIMTKIRLTLKNNRWHFK